MGIRFYASTTSEARFVLAADPAVAEANTSEALVAYLRTGDDEALVVPDGATAVVLRPLTHEELTSARSSAGPVPVLGLRVAAQEAPETAEEAEALASYRAWAVRASARVAVAAVVRIEGSPEWESVRGEEIPAALEAIRPVAVRSAVMGEIAIHAARLMDLPPEGKG